VKKQSFPCYKTSVFTLFSDEPKTDFAWVSIHHLRNTSFQYLFPHSLHLQPTLNPRSAYVRLLYLFCQSRLAFAPERRSEASEPCILEITWRKLGEITTDMHHYFIYAAQQRIVDEYKHS